MKAPKRTKASPLELALRLKMMVDQRGFEPLTF